jgi:hypothetical protein
VAMERFTALMVVTVLLVASSAAAAPYNPALIVANIDTGDPNLYTCVRYITCLDKPHAQHTMSSSLCRLSCTQCQVPSRSVLHRHLDHYVRATGNSNH